MGSGRGKPARPAGPAGRPAGKAGSSASSCRTRSTSAQAAASSKQAQPAASRKSQDTHLLSRLRMVEGSTSPAAAMAPSRPSPSAMFMPSRRPVSSAFSSACLLSVFFSACAVCCFDAGALSTAAGSALGLGASTCRQQQAGRHQPTGQQGKGEGEGSRAEARSSCRSHLCPKQTPARHPSLNCAQQSNRGAPWARAQAPQAWGQEGPSAGPRRSRWRS